MRENQLLQRELALTQSVAQRHVGHSFTLLLFEKTDSVVLTFSCSIMLLMTLSMMDQIPPGMITAGVKQQQGSTHTQISFTTANIATILIRFTLLHLHTPIPTIMGIRLTPIIPRLARVPLAALPQLRVQILAALAIAVEAAIPLLHRPRIIIIITSVAPGPKYHSILLPKHQAFFVLELQRMLTMSTLRCTLEEVGELWSGGIRPQRRGDRWGYI